MFSPLRKTFLIVTLSSLLLANVAVATADSLADVATVVDRTSHRASSWDRTGENDDNIMGLAPGETLVMLDTAGPGRIGHVWMTLSPFHRHETFLRDLTLRIYWEGAKVPSVEVPLGDFFGLGHGQRYKVCSAPVCVGANDRALNCYWPMPFYKHARVELYNNGCRSIRRIYFNIDYELGPIAPNQALFHAAFRRVNELPSKPFTKTGEDNFVILDTEGEGQYLGCFLYVDSAPGGWWGEGDEMIFLDGDKLPTITGTGTEDYFCNAWGFAKVFNYPYYGVPLLSTAPDGWKQTTAYRFHIDSPIRFKKSIRVTIEHNWGEKKNITNDYSCVAYWYQTKPITSREPLPVAEQNHPLAHPGKPVAKKPTSKKLGGIEFEPVLRQQGTSVKAITVESREGYSGGILQIDTQNQPVELAMPGIVPGRYRVKVRFYPLHKDQNTPITVGVKGRPGKTVPSRDKKGTFVDLGVIDVTETAPVLTFHSTAPLGLEVVTFDVEK